MTVVIPTYNRAALLGKAISSVLNQTYPHFEIVIADDGSTDDTAQIILSREDSRIKYLRLKHSGHIGKVRNAGAYAGHGEWIAFLDSDDQWVENKLALQVEKINESGKRWCYGGFEHIDENGNTLPAKAGVYQPLQGRITEALLRNEATVVICTLLVERKLFESTGGFSTDERLKLRGDYELALRLSLRAEAAALPGVLVRVLEHPGRVTRTVTDPYERSAMPYSVFLETVQDPLLRKIAAQRVAYLLSEAAVMRSAAGDHRKAINQLRQSIRKDRFRHWLSALYRTMKATFSAKQYLPASNEP